MLIKDVMNSKPSFLYEEDTISNASILMKKEKIRNLPIVNAESKLVGLITLREIVNALAGETLPDKILIKDAMLKQAVTVTPDMPLREAIEMMVVNKYGCLPVIDSENTLCGMISEYILLKALYGLVKMPDDFFSDRFGKYFT